MGAMKAAEVHGARAEFCCRSGAVGAMKDAEVHGARAEFCCRSGAVGAMKATEVHGARAEFCCRSCAGDTAAAETATGAAVEAATGVAVEAATGAAVEAATGAAAKVTAAAVCCGSVRGATEVAVVSGARAECSDRSGAGGTTAAAEESCASWSRRAAIPEQEGKSGAFLFSYKFIRTLLALASKVAVGELVAIEVLMYTTVRSIKDGEREARQASNMDFIGGEARGGANGVVIGILWCSLQTMANV